MSAHRFRFFGEKTGVGRWLVRDAEELAHLSKVLRLGVGAEVEVTDGAGGLAEGVLAEIAKTHALIATTSEAMHAPPRRRIVLALGALKHGAFDEILPGLVELGADEVHVFLQAGADKTRIAAKAVDRWQRIAAQALKQCKRVHRPALEVHASLDALLARLAGTAGREGIVLAPGASLGLLAALGQSFARVGSTGVMLAVGAEQGLDEKELQALRSQGFIAAHCGDGILRAVTAALTATAAASLVRGSDP